MGKKGLYIFRRELRTYDNTALIRACLECEEVLCVFIFTPEQITNNPYKSDNCVQFMCESLEELCDDIPLKMFYGKNISVISKIYKQYKFTDLYVNLDYTPYSKKRDEEIQDWCIKLKIRFHQIEDIMLYKLSDVVKADGSPYMVYSAFKNKVKPLKVSEPKKFDKNMRDKVVDLKLEKTLKKSDLSKFYTKNPNLHVRGGRVAAIDILDFMVDFEKYDQTRNFPSIESTSLSAYNKFGCVSIREVYHATPKKLGLIDQYIWRDFYYCLLYYFPESQNKSFKPEFQNIPWKNNEVWFKKWTEGMTGFPFVDAGMRQLNKTGYMHNRVRMVVANFLVKGLLIDWKWGESYFAKVLVDYDPAQNAGNWQWNASTGVDNFYFGPFRPFDPFQSKKYDNKAVYIKKWIPELENVPPIDLHRWNLKHDQYEVDYPMPMIDYPSQQLKFQKWYLDAKNK